MAYINVETRGNGQRIHVSKAAPRALRLKGVSLHQCNLLRASSSIPGFVLRGDRPGVKGVYVLTFMTSPLIFNFPLMNSCCAFVFPLTILAKSSSLKLNVTSALAGAPSFTSPFSLRSMCHCFVSFALFFRTKAKTALPCLTASARSDSEDWRAECMASKAADEGKASAIQDQS